jgi:tetratricopeptide (TPR) repeat protein
VKDYKNSLEYNLNSLPYWVKANDSDQESFTLMNIGNLYSYLGDKQKTVEYFEEALKKNELSERPSVKSVIQRDYANSLMRLGEEEKAIKLYEKSLKQWQATANIPEEARTAVLLAAHFGKNNDQQKAKHYYRHALEIWKKLDEKNEIKNIQTSLEKLGV